MSTKTIPEGYVQANHALLNEQINHLIESILPQFEKSMKSYVAFNIAFLTIGFTEIFLLVIFFAFLAKSSILAFSLAFVFLTFFSYFILRVYYQSKKPEQLIEIRDKFLRSCKALLNYQEGVSEHHIALSKACTRFADSLHGREYDFYELPTWFPKLDFSIEKFSCWWHWSDIHRMKEMLLIASVEENIKLVKCEPTNLQVHAALANAYVILSQLYVDPRKGENGEEDQWIPQDRFNAAMQEKFRKTAEKAIEEFKILHHYAPQDPWVHAQLAYSYHDLKMPKEEIKEYENILRINPDDKDTLYKLGILYFQQGMNAQGLRIFEELKRANPKKAEMLIKNYGAHELVSS